MKKNKEISDELHKLSPLLEHWHKDISEPKIPDGFFDTLQSSIFTAIDSLAEEDAVAETERISPILSELKKEETPTLAPDGFFHDMQETVFNHTTLDTQKERDQMTYSALSRPKIVRLLITLSAAAVVFLAIATTIHFLQDTAINKTSVTAKDKTIHEPAVIISTEREIPADDSSVKSMGKDSDNAAPSSHALATAKTENNSVHRDDILSYLIDDSSDMSAESIVDGLELTASVTYSSADINNLNNYLYENIEGLDEYELIKTTL